MHTLFNRKYAKILKIDRYVTVKRFDHTNEEGQSLFGIKQTNLLFYSDEIDPNMAFKEYCQHAPYLKLDGVRITRAGIRVCDESSGERDKCKYIYNIEGENFFTCSLNIHHAFILWKLQKLLQPILH